MMVLKYNFAWADASETCKKWIINGVRIPFGQIPESFHFETRKTFNRDEIKFINSEINDLLAKDCIEQCI